MRLVCSTVTIGGRRRVLALGVVLVVKKGIIAILVLASLVVGSCGFWFIAGKGSHRARFVLAMNELRRANADLQTHGAFTNRFQSDTVYPYTNQFTIDGKVYHCGLAIESVDLHLRDRGILAITTNGGFVWVDKQGGVMPLGNGPAFAFPPGI